MFLSFSLSFFFFFSSLDFLIYLWVEDAALFQKLGREISIILLLSSLLVWVDLRPRGGGASCHGGLGRQGVWQGGGGPGGEGVNPGQNFRNRKWIENELFFKKKKNLCFTWLSSRPTLPPPTLLPPLTKSIRWNQQRIMKRLRGKCENQLIVNSFSLVEFEPGGCRQVDPDRCPVSWWQLIDPPSQQQWRITSKTDPSEGAGRETTGGISDSQRHLPPTPINSSTVDAFNFNFIFLRREI